MDLRPQRQPEPRHGQGEGGARRGGGGRGQSQPRGRGPPAGGGVQGPAGVQSGGRLAQAHHRMEPRDPDHGGGPGGARHQLRGENIEENLDV